MKNLFLSLIITVFLIPLCLNANILYVPNNYPTIQTAMDSAVNGDTILVAPGIYFENVNFRGNGVLLSSYYLINHDTSFISNTVINGSTPVYPDTASCVLMTKPDITSAGDTTAALIGFTLTGGNGTVSEDIHYPGYYYREGGGIFIQYWAPRIRYNRIIGNHIDNDPLHPDGGGGGIRCCEGNPLIENNVIQYNSGYCGTAINFYFSSGIIRNNIVAGNYGGSVWGGGAIYTYSNCLQYPTLIENNTVINNSSTNGCGGMRLNLSNSVTVKNNIVWDNLPIQIYITGGNVSLSYCNIQGGWSGTGNINLDPQFINNSYYLSPTSPCIDAGDTGVSYNDPEDPLHAGLALWPSLGTIRNDMGVFGGPHSTVIGSFVIGINPISEFVPSSYFLSQNFPNPFNSSTKLKIEIPKPSGVKLVIYDILGKEIAVLVNDRLNPGIFETTWEANSYSSGVYFCRLILNNYGETIKLVLLK